MKKSTFILCLSILFVSILSAQNINCKKIVGNGNVISKTVTTQDYDKIKVSGFFDVELFSGKEGNITMEGEENLLEYIEFEVKDTTLKIYIKSGFNIKMSGHKKINIKVPFEQLNEVSLSGSGNVISRNEIISTKFTSNLSGSGNIDLSLTSDSISAKVSGSGDMELKGKTSDLNCDVTGSGNFNAKNLESNNVHSTVIGSGNCVVLCSESLYARVTGSGDIEYKGEPKKRDIKTTGSGNISKI